MTAEEHVVTYKVTWIDDPAQDRLQASLTDLTVDGRPLVVHDPDQPCLRCHPPARTLTDVFRDANDRQFGPALMDRLRVISEHLETLIGQQSKLRDDINGAARSGYTGRGRRG